MPAPCPDPATGPLGSPQAPGDGPPQVVGEGVGDGPRRGRLRGPSPRPGAPMTEPTTAPRTLRIDPPLNAEEVAFVAGFGRSAVPPHRGGRRAPGDVVPLRRVWPGRPAPWSPWVPCAA